MVWNDMVERRAFASRLKRRMEQLEFTQLDLAEQVGTARSAISGQLSPDGTWLAGDTMLQLPKALKCSGHWLLTGEGPEAPPSANYEASYRLEGQRAAIAVMRRLVDELEREVAALESKLQPRLRGR